MIKMMGTKGLSPLCGAMVCMSIALCISPSHGTQIIEDQVFDVSPLDLAKKGEDVVVDPTDMKENEVFLQNGVPHRGKKPVMPVNEEKIIKPPVNIEPDVPTDRTAGKGPKLRSRTKRGIIENDQNLLWTNGIIPYVITDQLGENDILAVYYAMEFVSNNTCIRFVPWDTTTKAKYGLANDGHLKFIKSGSCYSQYGNNFGVYGIDGQPISCCGALTCIHELGHAMGFHHEQKHPFNGGWLRMDWIGVGGNILNYRAEEPNDPKLHFEPYDVSSPMHYPVYFGKSEQMYLLAPEFSTTIQYHYFFKLASDEYKCQERNCSGVTKQCENEGFVTLSQGECACICPNGLDPDTGCTAPRTKTEAQTFPGGNYAILAPTEGCPSANGFQSGSVSHTYPFVRVHSPNLLLGSVANGVANTQFCVKQSNYDNLARWPRGSYCLFKVGTCPAGFYESTVTIGTDANGNSFTGTIPNVDLNDYDVKFYYCCRKDGIVEYPVDFANTKPFALVQQAANCQEVKGMGVVSKYFTVLDPMLTNAYVVTANGPRMYRNTASGETYFYYCYYYPLSDHSFSIASCYDAMGSCPSEAQSGNCDNPVIAQNCLYSCNKCQGPQTGSGSCVDTASDCDAALCPSYSSQQVDACKFTCRQCSEICGDVITLSTNERSTIITSPNYPLNYPQKRDCYWLVKGPVGSSLLVTFDDFYMQGTCTEDRLRINSGLISQHGETYCGQGMYLTIRSVSNTVEMRFTTDFQIARRGFNATVTLVLPEDHCFDQGQSGKNYRGTVSWTRDFKTCLPWSEVAHCRHSAYTPGDWLDGLENNYCRNPGDGLRPWCYYDAAECLRNYCDVCQLETPYDHIDTCADFEAAGNCTNEVDAREKCARTCQDQLPAVENTVHTDIQCGPPSTPPDGTPASSLQASYSLGDTVTFTCSATSSFSRTTTCLSDGSWSPIGYACGGCPDGWAYYRGYCYQAQLTRKTFADAQVACQALGGDLAEARDEELCQFLLVFRDDGQNQWFGLQKDAVEQVYQWQDGTQSAFTKWNQYSVANHECAVLTNTAYWQTSVCSGTNYYVCRKSAEVSTLCADLLSNCAERIAEEPNVCADQPDFAKLLCPKSCYGDCNDPCSTASCQNGGTCEVQGGSYVCLCTAQFEGDNCETAIVDDTLQSSCSDIFNQSTCDVAVSNGHCSSSKKHYYLYNCQSSCQYCEYNETSCVDADANCDYYALFYDPPQCTANPNWMLTNCKRSCGQCDGESCYDKRDNCKQLYWDGRCSDLSVKADCPNACGVCYNPRCFERSVNCDVYDKAYCVEGHIYYDFMRYNCPHFCGFCRETNACYKMPCWNGGTCTLNDESPTGYTCTCPSGYSGFKCEATPGGPCETNPCQNGATCLESGTNYKCLCDYGYGNRNCDWESPCLSSPCLNGGTCESSVGTSTFTCQCVNGYGGDFCADIVCADLRGDCAAYGGTAVCTKFYEWSTYNCPVYCELCAVKNPCWSEPAPCKNGGTCVQDSGIPQGYYCECQPNYIGYNCEAEDHCSQNPCQNGATCAVNLQDNTYTCTCYPGYFGTHCEAGSPCANSPCQNGGTCTENGYEYTCTCHPDYTGRDCEWYNLCKTDPCLNGGTCVPADGSCDCAVGFGGDICAETVCVDKLENCWVYTESDCANYEAWANWNCPLRCDRCALANPCWADPKPCQNGGSCFQDSNAAEGYNCVCAEGYIGPNCQALDVCTPDPCQNGATCIVNLSDSTYTCHCNPGYSGTQCEAGSPCSHDPCQNGGTCTENGYVYTCTCHPDYTGRDCEWYNLCKTDPCLNGGTCVPADGSCDCPVGFEGDLCAETVCVDKKSNCWAYADSVCADYRQWAGDQCPLRCGLCAQENPCWADPKPCLNGGSCFKDTNDPLNYTCSCASGYTGHDCEISQ